MSEKNYSDEELMRQELEKREQEQLKGSSEKKDLGKVDPKNKSNRISRTVDKEELNESVSLKTKGIEMNISQFPSKGKFYPTSTKIFIRSATVDEIKDYSLMDETDPLDINDKLNNLVSFCTTVEYGMRKGSYKDLLEDDKMFVLLSIKELTFPNGENKLNMKQVCSECEFENHFELRTENLNYVNENKNIAKYYDPVERCYIIPTKEYGVLQISPPTIGLMQEITSYARSKQNKREKWDRGAIQILPYLGLNWRGLNEEKIFESLVGMKSTIFKDDKIFSFVYRVIEMLKEGVKQTLTYECKKCQAQLDVDVNIEGGVKSLFIRKFSDDEELFNNII